MAESPEAHTLYYNLGLIYFKLNRLEDAESAFLKALELAKDKAKINFYLGSIYERLHRFKDAIYQYRQAGANIMVRRIEDKIARGPRPAAPAPLPRPPKRKDDTAEFPRELLTRRSDASTEATLRPDATRPRGRTPRTPRLRAARPGPRPSADVALRRPARPCAP